MYELKQQGVPRPPDALRTPFTLLVDVLRQFDNPDNQGSPKPVPWRYLLDTVRFSDPSNTEVGFLRADLGSDRLGINLSNLVGDLVDYGLIEPAPDGMVVTDLGHSLYDQIREDQAQSSIG